MKELLITIFTYNRPHYLAQLLVSLHLQTYTSFDIMIIDDCSSIPVNKDKMVMNIVNRLRNDNHFVYFFRTSSNKGISNARKEATKDISKSWKFCFDLNDDHFLEPDCIINMMNFIKNNHDVGCVGSCTPMIFWNDDEMIKHGDIVVNDFNTFKYDGKELIKLTRNVDYVYMKGGTIIDTPIKCGHLSQFIYRTGIVDVNSLINYSNVGFTEETDFSMSFVKKGYSLYFLPNCINWHMLSPYGGIRSIKNDDRMMMIQSDWKLFVNKWLNFARGEVSEEV